MAHTENEHYSPESHVMPVTLYWGIWATLIVCTALTVLAASVDLGVFNIVVALLIATFKGTLVVLFFMHLKYSMKLTMVTVIAALFWLFIMFSLTLTDYMTRHWLTSGL